MATLFNMNTRPAGINLLLIFRQVADLSRFLYTVFNYNFASDYRDSFKTNTICIRFNAQYR
jgi:hypothetical protein